jgi:acetyl esterase/lipase
MERSRTSSWAQLEDRLLPFTVGSLALVLLSGGGWFLGSRGEHSEWALYLLLGTMFPACVLALSLAGARRQHSLSATRLTGLVLGGIGLVLGGLFAATHTSSKILAIATVQWAVLEVLRRRARAIDPQPPVDVFPGLLGAVATFVAIALAWMLAARLCFWVDFGTLLTSSRWVFFTFFAAATLVTACLWREGTAERVSPADFVAPPLVILAAFRIDSLGGPDRFSDSVGLGHFAFYHWGPIVGPAELIRQGGWPLWDVPCQYGFLNTLIVTAIPFGSVWQSFYFVNAVLTAASALILFAVMRQARAGRAAPWLCLALACAAVYLVTGDLRLSTGPSIAPSTGAYRFFWCHALIGILVLCARVRLDDRPSRLALAAGCVAWWLGTLWSCESAAYCAAIWLPAFLWTVLDRAKRSSAGWGRVRTAAAWLAVPPFLLISSLAAIQVYYHAKLGHGPDWSAFVDFAFANIQSYGAPVDEAGAFWVPTLILCLLATLVASLIRGRKGASAVALATGAWAAVWSTCSYFVARSDPGLILNLCPVFCVAIAAAVSLLDRLGSAGGSPPLLRAAIMPLLIVILTLGFGNERHLVDWGLSLKRGYINSVEHTLPIMDPELVRLLIRAGVQTNDPVCFADRSILQNAMPVRPRPDSFRWVQKAWVPTVPFSLFAPLPESRARCYVSRFIERAPQCGWLVEPNLNCGPPDPLRWFYEEIARTHQLKKALDTQFWSVSRYEPRRGDPESEVSGDVQGVFQVKIIKDLEYESVSHPATERHRLDLYLPRGGRDFPIVIFAHGGAWVAGDKALCEMVGLGLARCGVGVALCNYCLYPNALFPANVEDVAGAVAWVRKKAALYGGRTDAIFVGGHSAGAHLASMLVCDDSYLKSAGLFASDLAGVIAISGVYSLRPDSDLAYGAGAQEITKASPVDLVHPGLTPFLLLRADEELPGLASMSDEFATALRQAGCDLEAVEVRGRDHASIISRIAHDGDPVRRIVLKFVRDRMPAHVRESHEDGS